MQDNQPMHLLISHSAPPGPRCQAAIAQLALPNLTEILGLLTATPPLLGAPDTLTPLPERLRAIHLGLQGADGLIPWAAMDAQQLGLTKIHGEAGWAWITPCHLIAQSGSILMKDPLELDVSAQECDTLRAAMKRYFDEDGIALHPLSNGTWLAFGEVFKDLPSASLERVAGSAIDSWMPLQEQARHLRRLQNEMQMLLYTHTINDARAASGKPTINAFWVSGTGTPARERPAATEPLECLDPLRRGALYDDPLAWKEAWETLDRTRLADLVQTAKSAKAVQLTLCGPRMAVTLELQNKPWWGRIQQRFSVSSPAQLLNSL
jgi:hypothetical protein